MPKGGASASGKRRAVRAVELAAGALAPGDSLRVDVLSKLVQRHANLQVVLGLMLDPAGSKFDVGESEMILDLVGSQTAYKMLASKLKHSFGKRILQPIDSLRSNHKPSATWSATIDWSETNDDGEVTSKKVSAWHVLEPELDLIAELNELGKRVDWGGRFVVRHIDGRNEIWVLVGGDAGNGSFKFGAAVLNQENPQSPLNVILMSWMKGAKDSRELLLETALRKDFTDKIDAMAQKKVVRIVTVQQPQAQSSKEDRIESYGCVLARDDLVLEQDRCVKFDDRMVSAAHADPVEPDVGAVVVGALAVRGDDIIGVAVLEKCAPAVEAARVLGEIFVERSDTFFNTVELVGEFLGATCYRVLSLIPLLEPLHVHVASGTQSLVMVEELSLKRMMTGDWAFICMLRGHQGPNARCLCPICDVTKEQAKLGLLGVMRTVQALIDCCERCPLNETVVDKKGKVLSRKQIQQTPRYKSNLFLSIEAAPVLKSFEWWEFSYSPLHWLLGEVWKAFVLAKNKLASIDGLDEAALALLAKLADAVAQRKQLATQLADAKQDSEDIVARIAKHTATLEKKTKELHDMNARIEATVLKNRAVPAHTSKAKDAMTAYIAREEKALAAAEGELKTNETALKELRKKDVEARKLVTRLEKETEYLKGKLVTALYKALESRGIVVLAWFQKLVGNHAVSLLKNTTYIWDDVAKAASTLPSDARAKFEEIRGPYERLWNAMHVIASTILKIDELTAAEVDALDEAIELFWHLSKSLLPVEEQDKDIPLKRHSLKHLAQRARRLHRVGIFSESIFESFHPEMNRIERRCNRIMNLIERNAAVRMQWLFRRSHAARKARAEHKAAVARKPRSS